MKVSQKVRCIDCVEGMKALNISPTEIIADPPYDFGQPYDAYEDNKGYDEYMAFTKRWLLTAADVLHKHGSMFIFCPDEWVSEIDMFCRHRLKMTKRRQIEWCFTFGQAAQKNWTRAHCHILYMTMTKTRFTFNEDAMRVPSARQLRYNDKRANPKGKMPDDVWMLLKEQLEPYMGPDKDAWLISRVCGTYKERQKHSPNQIPVPLMERLVLACSNPGDLVCDPFCGTGSSGVACAMHGRGYVGFDLSKKAVAASQQRIDSVKQAG